MKARITMNGCPKSKKDLAKSLASMGRLLEDMRMELVYLRFDVEACRRETTYWRKRAGGK